MSFVVTFQGQFKPLNLPEIHGYDHIHNIYKTRRAKKLKDNKEYLGTTLSFTRSKSNTNAMGIDLTV